MAVASESNKHAPDDSLYPIAVLIDELRNDDVQVIRIDCILVYLKPALTFPFIFFVRSYA